LNAKKKISGGYWAHGLLGEKADEARTMPAQIALQGRVTPALSIATSVPVPIRDTKLQAAAGEQGRS